MKQTFVYFQPEYVSKFQCNGQACDAHCCKRWQIDIDKKTYKKYSHLKPKSAAQEITSHLQENEQLNCYTVKLDNRGFCPMLTEDNWCKIQRTYGEEYLSNTCVTYPRITHQLGDFYERALTLTCPEVAITLLLTDEPITFEQTEVSKKVHDNLERIVIQSPPPWIGEGLLQYIPVIQTAAISILQERSLILDQRLIVLGFFLDKLDELLVNGKANEISNLAAFYMSEKFLSETAPQLVQGIKFNSAEHMRIIMGAFETLYGKNSEDANAENPYYIDSLVNTLEMIPDETGQIPLSKLVEKYKSYSEFRQKFLETYSMVFENYLVNEFFINLYPWKFSGSILHNYGIFLITYKMLEMITLSLAVSNFKKDPTKQPPLDRIFFTATVMRFANNIDHDPAYTEKISQYLEDKNDIISLMKSLLQN